MNIIHATFMASTKTGTQHAIMEIQTVHEVVSQGESSTLLKRELDYLSDTDRQALLCEAGVELEHRGHLLLRLVCPGQTCMTA